MGLSQLHDLHLSEIFVNIIVFKICLKALCVIEVLRIYGVEPQLTIVGTSQKTENKAR